MLQLHWHGMTINSISSTTMITIPAVAITAWKFTKGLFASVSAKQWMYLGIVLVLAFAQYQFYGWAHDSGKSAQFKADTAYMNAANARADRALEQLAALRSTHVNSVLANETSLAEMKVKNDELNTRLANLVKVQDTAHKAKQKVLIREIPTFIPKSVNFDLPRGFVQLYNHSIQTPTFGTQGTVSYRPEGDPTAPSGVTLTAAAPIILFNNEEALRRGEIIESWQTWYKESKVIFDQQQLRYDEWVKSLDEANAKAAKEVKRLPAAPELPSPDKKK